MLDLHAVTAVGGSTGGLGGTFIIAAGGDGQTVAGVPIKPNATLVSWGGVTTIADTIEELRMRSQDSIDPLNGEDWFPGAASVHGYFTTSTNIPYSTGLRQFAIDQNTAANPCMCYTLDAYPDEGSECKTADYFPLHKILQNQTFGGALTAITWGQVAYAPAIAHPNGKYALHGCWVNGLTNYAFIRFQHADFKGLSPGFPTIDCGKAIARAVSVTDPLMDYQGYQFDYLSEITKKPCVPTFSIGNSGTGLIIQCIAITADTPCVTLNISKIA